MILVRRKAWTERRGPQYYHFIYKDVLFIVLDTEDAERPMPENMEEDIATYNKLKKEDPQKAMAFIIEWMSTPEAQEAFGHSAKVEFPEAQRAWLKKVLEENEDVRWTFLFLHEPVWNSPSDSFTEMDQMLQDRDFTFLAAARQGKSGAAISSYSRVSGLMTLGIFFPSAPFSFL